MLKNFAVPLFCAFALLATPSFAFSKALPKKSLPIPVKEPIVNVVMEIATGVKMDKPLGKVEIELNNAKAVSYTHLTLPTKA